MWVLELLVAWMENVRRDRADSRMVIPESELQRDGGVCFSSSGCCSSIATAAVTSANKAIDCIVILTPVWHCSK